MMALMTEEEVLGMIRTLEQQEIDCQTGSGTVPVSVYCELLACYLATEPPNLPQAKLLMQRVPESVKESEEGAELSRLWKIGKSMWTRNTPEVYNSLIGPWSQPVQRIVDKLSNSLKQTNLKLVGDAYSSVKLSQLASLLGLGEEDAKGVAEREGWGVDTEKGIVMPRRSREDRGHSTNTEDQLEKIINFVSYLEN